MMETEGAVAAGDACLTCLEYGGGTGCLDRCTSEGSDCASCVQYGGGSGCIPRCGGGGGGGGGGAGRVDAMYTWGAASPFLEAQFSDPATRGCWEGQRIVTADTAGAYEDIVPELLRCSYGCFEHARQATVK